MFKGLICAVVLAFATPAWAGVTLSPGQMRELAAQAAIKGQPGLAFDLASALLRRDENDLDAHLVLSRAARDLGRYDEALTHARAAWRLAETPPARFAAALANAQALSSTGRFTLAQLWLRRAVQVAPDDRSKAQAARDFRYVRFRNPLSTHLSFSITPTSNINNGSKNETSELFDLPFEFQLQGAARALSGLEIAAGIDASYRLRATRTRRMDGYFSLSHRGYVLSDEAKKIAPDASGSDFALTSLSFGLKEQYLLEGGKSRFGWNATLGQNWYGGDPLFRYYRIGADYGRFLSPRHLLTTGLTREVQQGMGSRDDAMIWTGSLGISFPLHNKDRLSLSTAATWSQSAADYLDYTNRSVTVGYRKSRPVGSVGLEFGLTLSKRDHDRSAYSSDGRHETGSEAWVTATLRKMDYYGFVPTVTFSARKTRANIDLYEADEFGIRVGVRSAF